MVHSKVWEPESGTEKIFMRGWCSRMLELEQSEEGIGEGMELVAVMGDWLCMRELIYIYREDNGSQVSHFHFQKRE